MTKRENEYINRWVKRIEVINELGGKCTVCGETNIHLLEFHHVNKNDKDTKMGTHGIRFSLSLSNIKKEAKKCILLCGNCHIEEHYNYEIQNRDRTNKIICLIFKDIFKCEICGYNKCNKALEFHHKDDKLFNIGDVTNIKRWDTIDDIEKSIKNELNKCSVLCSNCHQLQHVDIEKFEKNKDMIYTKEIRKTSKPVDINLVKQMIDNGMKQHEIRKQLNVAKSTICRIVKLF